MKGLALAALPKHWFDIYQRFNCDVTVWSWLPAACGVSCWQYIVMITVSHYRFDCLIWNKPVWCCCTSCCWNIYRVRNKDWTLRFEKMPQIVSRIFSGVRLLRILDNGDPNPSSWPTKSTVNYEITPVRLGSSTDLSGEWTVIWNYMCET